jgi:hypothetical protein
MSDQVHIPSITLTVCLIASVIKLEALIWNDFETMFNDFLLKEISVIESNNI